MFIAKFDSHGTELVYLFDGNHGTERAEFNLLIKIANRRQLLMIIFPRLGPPSYPVFGIMGVPNGSLTFVVMLFGFPDMFSRVS